MFVFSIYCSRFSRRGSICAVQYPAFDTTLLFCATQSASQCSHVAWAGKILVLRVNVQCAMLVHGSEVTHNQNLQLLSFEGS